MPQIARTTKLVLWLALLSSLAVLLAVGTAYLYLSPKLPAVDSLRDVQLQTPLRIYSQDGKLIGEFGEKRRTPVSYQQIPPTMINAFLAAEDDRFFSHHGVDIKGLLRAALQLVTTGRIQTGGSTITMQVAKNYFLSHERTFSRKFNEIFLALQIERELSKPEILELYLNKIFLGHRAYGIEAAAQVYYGKSIHQLSLAQQAMIAGLPKAPSAYNPLINPSRALIRRNWILDRMLTLGYIDAQQHQQASNALISAEYHGTPLDLDAPYVAEMARQELLERYGNRIYTDGYQVVTTIRADLQQTAELAVSNGLLAYDQRHGYRGAEAQLPQDPQTTAPTDWLNHLRKQQVLAGLVPAIVTAVDELSFSVLLTDGSEQTLVWEQDFNDFRPYLSEDQLGDAPSSLGELLTAGDLIRLQQSSSGSWRLSQLPQAQAALIALDADSGAILSLIGGFDFQRSKFNRVTQANRQPGSNFKPFIYTAALDAGYTAASIINDAPIVFEDKSLESTWRPTNSSGKFLGPTRLRKALYQSRNLVSIRLLRELGISRAIDYVQRFGFDADSLPRDLSLALGSHSLPPLKIVSAYAVLANGGYKVEPYLIERIESVQGEILYQAQPRRACRDCEPQSAPTPDRELATLEDILDQGDADTATAAQTAERIIEPRVAYIIDDMLKDVVRRGTGRRARGLGRNDIAGKTGTTNGPTDAWFSGYGGGIVTTTWLGFDNNHLLGKREYGGSAALPIWIDYMRFALRDRPERQVKLPDGLITVKIDPETGELATPGQRDAIFEIFRQELAPSKSNNSGSAEGSKKTSQDDIF